MGAQQSRQSLNSTATGTDKPSKRHSRADKLASAFKSLHKSKGNLRADGRKEEDSVSREESQENGVAEGQGQNTTQASGAGGETAAATATKQPPQMPSQGHPATVPCQYRTGRTLGSGTYAIVKEAIHIHTNQYYACKVINKKLMEGREHMVRNEIAVLKRISKGHPNIVTLRDYFETAHNLYLVFDLCTGGELFDRICAKGNYYEADAAGLVRTIFKAVKYIHDEGIVHRDLKPENLLFRTPEEDADIMIADFGLSRVMEEEKLKLLTEICGTPGYMAPEIFKKTGHSKPVDIWAMGVITYFLLAGYTPFDRDSQQQEMEAILAGDYKFEPAEYWENVSDTAKDFVRYCLTMDPLKRPTAEECLKHQWLADEKPHFVAQEDGAPADLLPHVKKAFNAKHLWRKATFSIRAVNRMAALAGQSSSSVQELRTNLDKYKEESEKEVMENASVTHHHNEEHPSEDEITDKLARTSIHNA